MTFIFSFDWCFLSGGGGAEVKTYFGLSFYQNIEIQQNILLMSAVLKDPKF